MNGKTPDMECSELLFLQNMLESKILSHKITTQLIEYILSATLLLFHYILTRKRHFRPTSIGNIAERR